MSTKDVIARENALVEGIAKLYPSLELECEGKHAVLLGGHEADIDSINVRAEGKVLLLSEWVLEWCLGLDSASSGRLSKKEERRLTLTTPHVIAYGNQQVHPKVPLLHWCQSMCTSTGVNKLSKGTKLMVFWWDMRHNQQAGKADMQGRTWWPSTYAPEYPKYGVWFSAQVESYDAKQASLHITYDYNEPAEKEKGQVILPLTFVHFGVVPPAAGSKAQVLPPPWKPSAAAPKPACGASGAEHISESKDFSLEEQKEPTQVPGPGRHHQGHQHHAKKAAEEPSSVQEQAPKEGKAAAAAFKPTPKAMPLKAQQADPQPGQLKKQQLPPTVNKQPLSGSIVLSEVRPEDPMPDGHLLQAAQPVVATAHVQTTSTSGHGGGVKRKAASVLTQPAAANQAGPGDPQRQLKRPRDSGQGCPGMPSSRVPGKTGKPGPLPFQKQPVPDQKQHQQLQQHEPCQELLTLGGRKRQRGAAQLSPPVSDVEATPTAALPAAAAPSQVTRAARPIAAAEPGVGNTVGQTGQASASAVSVGPMPGVSVMAGAPSAAAARLAAAAPPAVAPTAASSGAAALCGAEVDPSQGARMAATSGAAAPLLATANPPPTITLLSPSSTAAPPPAVGAPGQPAEQQVLQSKGQGLGVHTISTSCVGAREDLQDKGHKQVAGRFESQLQQDGGPSNTHAAGGSSAYPGTADAAAVAAAEAAAEATTGLGRATLATNHESAGLPEASGLVKSMAAGGAPQQTRTTQSLSAAQLAHGPSTHIRWPGPVQLSAGQIDNLIRLPIPYPRQGPRCEDLVRGQQAKRLAEVSGAALAGTPTQAAVESSLAFGVGSLKPSSSSPAHGPGGKSQKQQRASLHASKAAHTLISISATGHSQDDGSTPAGGVAEVPAAGAAGGLLQTAAGCSANEVGPCGTESAAAGLCLLAGAVSRTALDPYLQQQHQGGAGRQAHDSSRQESEDGYEVGGEDNEANDDGFTFIDRGDYTIVGLDPERLAAYVGLGGEP